eukprot:TRINITY_DN9607_c0_g1_i3.p2 TRINITY_DN9607_c0_g1~~TRINITY_DN9607_c0_g1_i3.p2  ORF type:complete len:152 (+),score=42.96 TRINITY_DN9607_c0_g1_i3:536-991(+)
MKKVNTPFGELDGFRKQRADQLFAAYDGDNSGSIDLKEFAALCHNYDETITFRGLKALFDKVNADGNDVIDLEEFYAWVVLCFGQCGEDEFIYGTDELLKAVKGKEPSLEIMAKIEAEMKTAPPLNPAIAPDGARRTGFRAPPHVSQLPAG